MIAHASLFTPYRSYAVLQTRTATDPTTIPMTMAPPITTMAAAAPLTPLLPSKVCIDRLYHQEKGRASFAETI